MEPRDELILRTGARYRILVRPVVSALCGGIDPSNILKRLIADQALVSRPGLPGNASYYQPTERVLERLGRPRTRARPPGPASLSECISLVWFCTMSSTPQPLLEAAEVEELMGAPGLPGSHVLHPAGERSAIMHTYVPGENTSPAVVARRTLDRALEAQAMPHLRDWVETRTYGFLVLVATSSKKQAVKQALETAAFHERARFAVALAPNPQTLLHFAQRSHAVA